MAVIDPSLLYTVADAAAYLRVSIFSIYKSIPGCPGGPKLRRPLPDPIRIGSRIRWTGQQLMDYVFASCPSARPVAPAQVKDAAAVAAAADQPIQPMRVLMPAPRAGRVGKQVPARGRGRPRNAPRAATVGGAK